MKKFLILIPALACIASGCVRGGAYSAQDTAKFNQEDSAKFVLLDHDTRLAVTCTGIQEGRTQDGRLKLVANLRNRKEERIEVQVSCVFKDQQAYAIDETPYRTLILDENSTQSVAFESHRKDTTNYTIRVRKSR